jgi:DNA-binding response OmpR family regulator
MLLVAIDESDQARLRVGLADSMNLVAVSSALSALARFAEIDPDAVLVSAQLADVDSVEWIRSLREVTAVPIVVGTEPRAIDLAGDLIKAGASAIVRHPFACEEILDRLRESLASALRKRREELRLEVGPLQLDSAAFSVHLSGHEVIVTLKEFELLRCLMLHADRVVALEEIHDDLWGDGHDAPSLDAIKLHVRKLRQNLGDPTLVRTVRGHGYTVSHLRDDERTAV